MALQCAWSPDFVFELGTSRSPRFRYCLCVSRSDPATSSPQQYSVESVDSFSRRDVCVCFEDMKSFETFVDAVKRCCASAAQALNYIDSLPLAPKRDKGANGNKGCARLAFESNLMSRLVIFDS